MGLARALLSYLRVTVTSILSIQDSTMQAEKILFPTDFSRTGDAALHLATVLAKESGATLLIAHVVEPTNAYTGGEFYYGIPEPSNEELERMLGELTPHDPAVPFERRLVFGSPASALIKLAEDEHVDMIVMGTHGRSGLSRVLMGSVAELIMRGARCPVLTYKAPLKHVASVSQ
jgi:universal stress protein A